MKRGLYRMRGVDGRPDDVRVDDAGIETPMEEQLYRAHGYAPPVEELPWQEEFKTRSAGSDRGAESEKAAREQARQEFRARFRRP